MRAAHSDDVINRLKINVILTFLGVIRAVPYLPLIFPALHHTWHLDLALPSSARATSSYAELLLLASAAGKMTALLQNINHDR